MDLPFITDPFFYLVAVPSVLLVGISKSGFGMGFGSLATPLMALTVTVPQAAAIMVPLLTAIDLMGIRALRKDLDKQLFKFLLPWALLGVVIGAVLFGLLDAKVVAGIVGILPCWRWHSAFFSRQMPTASHRRAGWARSSPSLRASPALWPMPAARP